MLENLIGRGATAGRDKVGLGSIRRPVIGLALGGGAARGFAHIGILRSLLANGVVPDVVVGTSIGAVVGGSYAAGHLDALEDWARSLQPRSVFGYLDIRLNGSGLIGGEKLATQLESTIGAVQIADLPVKFASVATEVRTGHEIWLTQGRLVDAVRASYALPGIFAPVLVGDRWLVDGALVNPVPVSAARALGAEIVIAANVSSDVFGHGTTIFSHGTPLDEADPVPGAGAEAWHRPVLLAGMDRETGNLRHAGASGHLHRDGRRLQHHAGPHHPRAARRRSTRPVDLAAGRQDRLVRFPSRRRTDGARRPRRRSRHRVDQGERSKASRPEPRGRRRRESRDRRSVVAVAFTRS